MQRRIGDCQVFSETFYFSKLLSDLAETADNQQLVDRDVLRQTMLSMMQFDDEPAISKKNSNFLFRMLNFRLFKLIVE